jgi:hypothetical protein
LGRPYRISGGSSNGRTAAFGVADGGSNPPPPAINQLPVLSSQFPMNNKFAGIKKAPLAKI